MNTISDKDMLSNQVKQHFDDFNLSDAQADQLGKVMLRSRKPVTQTSFLQRYKSISAVAVLMLLVVISFGFREFHQHQLSAEIASEVSYNHNKLKPMEVSGNNFSQVADYFSELEFSPLQSDYLSAGSLTLIGGRYCSIQGSPAAQLRYLDDNGQLVTLFETNYDSRKFNFLPVHEKGEKPRVIYSRGYKVNMWIEKGLVMASVQKPDAS